MPDTTPDTTPETQPVEPQPLTDLIMGDREGTWFYFAVQGGGNVRVLALDATDAQKIVAARYPDMPFTFGLSKARPMSGDSYLRQVPVYTYPEGASTKDIDEMARRDGVNYEFASR